ncbi:MAG TPA: chorismate mutase [Planctomycetaceae bacterium]|nr:chorismate mutase [Planctomycetaceae bacterium]
MYFRGIRGATTVEENTSEAILRGTRELLALMIRTNGVKPEDVCSVIFTLTRDLDAEFPALAARQMRWTEVPLLCTNELPIAGALSKCVRILIHWNTEKKADEIVHVYIRDAATLRPDISQLPPVDWAELDAWIDANIDDALKSQRS